MLGMEVPASNLVNFATFLVHYFYAVVTALLEYPNPAILHLFSL